MQLILDSLSIALKQKHDRRMSRNTYAEKSFR